MAGGVAVGQGPMTPMMQSYRIQMHISIKTSFLRPLRTLRVAARHYSVFVKVIQIFQKFKFIITHLYSQHKCLLKIQHHKWR